MLRYELLRLAGGADIQALPGKLEQSLDDRMAALSYG
jgi:hypothetical protein